MFSIDEQNDDDGNIQYWTISLSAINIEGNFFSRALEIHILIPCRTEKTKSK